MKIHAYLDPLSKRSEQMLYEEQQVHQYLWWSFGLRNDGTEERGDLSLSEEDKEKAKEYYYNRHRFISVDKDGNGILKEKGDE